MTDKYKPDTLGVRAGGVRSDFREHSEALVLSTSFVYASAEEAARKFASTASLSPSRRCACESVIGPE